MYRLRLLHGLQQRISVHAPSPQEVGQGERCAGGHIGSVQSGPSADALGQYCSCARGGPLGRWLRHGRQLLLLLLHLLLELLRRQLGLSIKGVFEVG